MAEYSGSRKNVDNGVFGEREFVASCGEKIIGELYAEGGRYFALVGRAIYRATMETNGEGLKHWRLHDKSPVLE